jgi:4-aminobutyrate aminotransferase-like enzyme
LIGDGLLENATELGTFRAGCAGGNTVPASQHRRINGKGLMIGVEFVKDRQTKEHATPA